MVIRRPSTGELKRSFIVAPLSDGLVAEISLRNRAEDPAALLLTATYEAVLF
jgi:hypothetical protein